MRAWDLGSGAMSAQARRVRELVKFKDPNGFQGELYCGPLIEERPFHPNRPMSGFVTGIHGMGHAFLGVKDLEETAAFYRDLLGFRVRDYINAAEFNLDMVFMYCNPRHHSLALSLGQHTNDHMVSFYVVTPSGFWIEYGFGGLLVADESSWVVQHHLAAHFWGHKPVAALDAR